MIFEKMSIHNKIVVQELKGSRKNSTLDKSIILSYLINFFYNEEFDPGSG